MLEMAMEISHRGFSGQSATAFERYSSTVHEFALSLDQYIQNHKNLDQREISASLLNIALAYVTIDEEQSYARAIALMQRSLSMQREELLKKPKQGAKPETGAKPKQDAKAETGAKPKQDAQLDQDLQEQNAEKANEDSEETRKKQLLALSNSLCNLGSVYVLAAQKAEAQLQKEEELLRKEEELKKKQKEKEELLKKNESLPA